MADDDSTLSFNEKIIAEFRANEGRAEAFGDTPLLLLTTKGAKTGKEHTSPVMYLATNTTALSSTSSRPTREQIPTLRGITTCSPTRMTSL